MIEKREYSPMAAVVANDVTAANCAAVHRSELDQRLD